MLFIWTPGHICENVKYMQTHKPRHFLHLRRLGWTQPTISHPEFSSNSFLSQKLPWRGGRPHVMALHFK